MDTVMDILQIPCINWSGATNEQGRGVFQIQKKQFSASRLALSIKLGRHIKLGMQANHLCNNHQCVNPFHLYEGSQKENIADCIKSGRRNNPAGEAHWNHKHQPEKIIEVKKLLAQGIRNGEIAKSTGFTPQYVNKIRRGDIWKWLTI